MDADLVQLLRLRRPSREARSRDHLVACSICLRVHRGSQWLDAEQVIRELRSYELESPPHLDAAVCEACAEAIFARRAQSEEPVAA
jgi:NMD protein affecting ribosome stability and mRNA decay